MRRHSSKPGERVIVVPDCKCTQAHCNRMLANPALWVSAGPFYPLSYLFRSHTNTHLQTQSCSCCWFVSMPSLIWNKSNTTCLRFLMRLSAMNGLTPRWNKGLSYVNWPCFLRFLLTPLLMMEGSNRKFTVLADTYRHTCGKKKKKNRRKRSNSGPWWRGFKMHVQTEQYAYQRP